MKNIPKNLQICNNCRIFVRFLRNKSNMAVIIQEVKNCWQRYQFATFSNKLYKDCEAYCPRLILDELNTFSRKKNPSYDVCESVEYLAYRDGKIVGRIAGIINRAANEKWGVKKVRFGWIDFIDDMEVSRALLDTVAAWGKSKGMNILNGPVGFTDWDYEGLLIEGFEYLAPAASLYNYPYYQKHLEAYGLQKEADWIEYQLYPKEVPARMERMAKIVADRFHVHIDKVRSTKELVRKYGIQYMDVLDTAYQQLYNFQPMTERQKNYYKDMYFPLLNFDFVTVIANDQNECVGVAVGMPDISKALKKCNGRMFPFGWYHILRALKTKQMDKLDLLLVGVRPDYLNRGLDALMLRDFIHGTQKYKVKEVETTSMLEDNNKVHTIFEDVDKIQHKRRRAFEKTI